MRCRCLELNGKIKVEVQIQSSEQSSKKRGKRPRTALRSLAEKTDASEVGKRKGHAFVNLENKALRKLCRMS